MTENVCGRESAKEEGADFECESRSGRAHEMAVDLVLVYAQSSDSGVGVGMASPLAAAVEERSLEVPATTANASGGGGGGGSDNRCCCMRPNTVRDDASGTSEVAAHDHCGLTADEAGAAAAARAI